MVDIVPKVSGCQDQCIASNRRPVGRLHADGPTHGGQLPWLGKVAERRVVEMAAERFPDKDSIEAARLFARQSISGSKHRPFRMVCAGR